MLLRSYPLEAKLPLDLEQELESLLPRFRQNNSRIRFKYRKDHPWKPRPRPNIENRTCQNPLLPQVSPQGRAVEEVGVDDLGCTSVRYQVEPFTPPLEKLDVAAKGDQPGIWNSRDGIQPSSAWVCREKPADSVSKLSLDRFEIGRHGASHGRAGLFLAAG